MLIYAERHVDENTKTYSPSPPTLLCQLCNARLSRYFFLIGRELMRKIVRGRADATLTVESSLSCCEWLWAREGSA